MACRFMLPEIYLRGERVLLNSARGPIERVVVASHPHSEVIQVCTDEEWSNPTLDERWYPGFKTSDVIKRLPSTKELP